MKPRLTFPATARREGLALERPATPAAPRSMGRPANRRPRGVPEKADAAPAGGSGLGGQSPCYEAPRKASSSSTAISDRIPSRALVKPRTDVETELSPAFQVVFTLDSKACGVSRHTDVLPALAACAGGTGHPAALPRSTGQALSAYLATCGAAAGHKL